MACRPVVDLFRHGVVGVPLLSCAHVIPAHCVSLVKALNKYIGWRQLHQSERMLLVFIVIVAAFHRYTYQNQIAEISYLSASHEYYYIEN